MSLRKSTSSQLERVLRLAPKKDSLWYRFRNYEINFDLYKHTDIDTVLLCIFVGCMFGYLRFFAYEYMTHTDEYFNSGLGMFFLIFGMMAFAQYIGLLQIVSLQSLRYIKKYIKWKCHQGLSEYQMYKSTHNDTATSPTSEMDDTSDLTDCF